jgi:CcmD family protein
MSDLGWLAVAFLAVWIGIGGYVFILGRRQSKLEQRLNELARDEN